MEIADHTATVPAEEAASGVQVPRQPPPKMNAHAVAGSSTAPAAEGGATSPPPRVLDSDPSKFRSLKRVIAIGRPGSGIDGEC